MKWFPTLRKWKLSQFKVFSNTRMKCTAMPETDGFHIRTYREGDEKELSVLFNDAYQHYAGFAPRTVEYWKWSILSRPNLSREGIAVVVNVDQVVGYAAVDKLGNILEFCYDLNYDSKTIVSMLLDWCIDYVKSEGGSSISLNVPAEDDLLRQVCRELGLTEDPFHSLFLRVFDFPQLFGKIVDQRGKLEEHFDETVLINLRKVPFWCDNYVVIRVQTGKTILSTEKVETPTIRIDADISTLSSCIFGSTGICRAIVKGQLKVRPFWKIPRAVKLFSMFQLKDPWYVPRADYG